MKRNILLCALALFGLAVLSCNKESNSPDNAIDYQQVDALEIEAFIENGNESSKTTYENETRFLWVEGDRVTLPVKKKSDNSLSWYNLRTKEGGRVVRFGNDAKNYDYGDKLSGIIGNDYLDFGYALYPDKDRSDNAKLVPIKHDENLAVTIQQTITPDLSNPMNVIPMIGKKITAEGDDKDRYKFTTAMGILKVTFNYIPAGATQVRLDVSDEAYALNGSFDIHYDSSEDVTYIREEDVIGEKTATMCKKYVSFTPAEAYENRSFYIPIPVGTIPANKLVVSLYAGSTKIISKKATKQLVINRNEVLTIPAINCPWKPLGAGYYLDNYLFGVAGGSVHVENGGKVGYYVEVEMFQSTKDPQSYRIVKPYESAWEQLSITAGSSLSDLSFRIINNGESFASKAGREVTSDRNGLVFFYGDQGNYENDVKANSADHASRLFHPNWAALTDMSYNTHSFVKIYQDDGVTPACVQLAPRIDLNGGYDTKHEFYTNNDVIYIVFPECNPGLMVAGDYYINNDSQFIVTITTSDDLSKGNIMISRYRGTSAKLPGGGNTGSTCDISGKCYGNYADGTLTFAGGQLFAAVEGHEGYYWTLFAGDNGNHAETIVLTFQYKENFEIGKVLTRPRFGLGYGTSDQVSSRSDTESGQVFSASWMRKENFD